MLKQSNAVVVTAICAVSLGVTTAHAAVLVDDFTGPDGSAPDSTKWTTFTYGNSTTGSQNVLSGGSLFISAGNTASHYSGTVSKSRNISAFDGPLVIDLDGVDLGTTSTTSSRNVGWVFYGRSNLSSLEGASAQQYRPLASTVAYGFGASVRYNQTDGYTLLLAEFSDTAGGGTAFSRSYNLTEEIEGLKLVIDGSARTLGVTISGGQFSATQTEVNPTRTATTLSETLSSDFTLSNLSDTNGLAARISLGATNGALNTSLTVGSINVSVPEPAGLGLLAGCSALLLGRRRRS